MKESKLTSRPVSHTLLMDMRFMHKYRMCKTKGKVSEGVIKDHVYVMVDVSHRLYAMTESVVEEKQII